MIKESNIKEELVEFVEEINVGKYNYGFKRICLSKKLNIDKDTIKLFLTEHYGISLSIDNIDAYSDVENIFYRALMDKSLQGVSDTTIDKYISDYNRFIKDILGNVALDEIERPIFSKYFLAFFMVFEPSYTTFRNFKSLWNLIFNYALKVEIIYESLYDSFDNFTNYILLWVLNRANAELDYNVYHGIPFLNWEDTGELAEQIKNTDFSWTNKIKDNRRLSDFVSLATLIACL